ncbi:MAG: PrsW family intramembrane metalloprotease [Erysipelotrichaceae bacterium]|nr:PrsW family intramembrane metalloprotease [Erysipelotrichaceae bacterium]
MDILLVVIASVVPAFLLYLWLRNLNREKEGYRENCRSSMRNGIVSSGAITLSCLILTIVFALVGINKLPPLVTDAIKCFILFALMEELWKFLYFRKTLKQATGEVSYLDVIIFMTLVGAGFGILEDIFYAFTTSVGQGIVRGVTMGHAVYGFIMGYFISKAMRTGKNGYNVLAFMIPYLWHGIYDFTLSENLPRDQFIFDLIPVTLAFLEFIMVFVMIIFFLKARKKPEYNEPIAKTEDA